MNKITLITVIIIVIIIAGGLWYYFDGSGNSGGRATESTGVKVEISDKIMASKIGFLGGGPVEGGRMIIERGGAWVRPHPGPFLWDSIQSKENGDYDWRATDQVVSTYQKDGVAILATIWPFAEWDQMSRADPADCAVAPNDEFLPHGFKKRDGEYLPEHRCAPQDWDAYATWVRALVERYDGDGEDDMAGLKQPIEYWEISNEPDLSATEPDFAPPEEENSLNFFKGTPADYGELLVKTGSAIKSVDPNAKVIIAGAAGADERMLNFYRQVFAANDATKTAFDIGNVHCISNDRDGSFNAITYKKMLAEYGIDVPLWITEAENMISEDPDVNASSFLSSSELAFESGVERIFFTRMDFYPQRGFDDHIMNEKQSGTLDGTVDGNDPEAVFVKISEL